MIFGLELDGGKAWRKRSPGALEGGYTRRRRQRDRGVCRGPKAKERACSRLLQKLVLRDPKATLDIWACTGRTGIRKRR